MTGSQFSVGSEGALGPSQFTSYNVEMMPARRDSEPQEFCLSPSGALVALPLHQSSFTDGSPVTGWRRCLGSEGTSKPRRCTPHNMKLMLNSDPGSIQLPLKFMCKK